MVRISVIDTHADINHPVFKHRNINVETNPGIVPYAVNGHGTAVCGIIAKETPDAEITLYPLFPKNDEGVGTYDLIKTLQYIHDKKDCDIINLSCGLVMPEDAAALYAVCARLRQSGVWIVSAFENMGMMSYPACFDNVIGVDQGNEINTVKEFIWVENSPVNIIGYPLQHRVPWLNDSYLLVKGTSFLAPYITGIVASLLLENKTDVPRELALLSKKIQYNAASPINKPDFTIKRAVVFPFGKEIHALIRFYDRLRFTIDNIYDVKYFYNIGKKPEQIIHVPDRGLKKIENYANINWDDGFDTIIIAHVDQLLRFMKRQTIEDLIVSALRCHKNIYTFDKSVYDAALSKKDALSSKSGIYFPSVNTKCLEYSHQGRMWMHAVPIVGIFGTSSKQGKYTLQLLLDGLLRQKGYTTGLLSTEPNGWLMGMDAVYHFGYGNSTSLSEKECIVLLNQTLHYIEQVKNPDIIIAASQSGSIPHDNYVPSCISIAQTAFLHGISPDAIILCVNLDDDMDYIKRTVSHIEGYVNTRVICIVVFPFVNDLKFGSFAVKRKVVDRGRYDAFKARLSGFFAGAVVFGHNLDFSEAAERIVEYLSA